MLTLELGSIFTLMADPSKGNKVATTKMYIFVYSQKLYIYVVNYWGNRCYLNDFKLIFWNGGIIIFVTFVTFIYIYIDTYLVNKRAV